MLTNKLLYAVMLIILFTIVGCVYDESNELSDLADDKIASFKQAINDYCSKTSDSIIKKAALLIIHAELPGYPAHGICDGWYPPIYKSDLIDNFIRAGPPDPLPA